MGSIIFTDVDLLHFDLILGVGHLLEDGFIVHQFLGIHSLTRGLGGFLIDLLLEDVLVS